jgi:hypothetical protein
LKEISDMLTALVAEARALVETLPTSAAAQATLPLATRWLLVMLRKDAKARETLLDGVEELMEAVIERIVTPTRHAAPTPAKKGRGKQASAAPEPPSSTGFDIKAMTPQDLVARAVDELDKNKSSVVSTALNSLRYEEAFEEWLLEALNKQVRTATGLGPWSCFVDVEPGKIRVRMRIADEEQDEDTEHPGDTSDEEIARAFKTVLGAAYANFSWSLGRTPREWGAPSGDKLILNYQGHAEFEYRDGQAALFATGNKAWIEIAAKVLARASEE